MDNYNYWKLNNFDEREKCYKEKIEQLENDLDKERNICDVDNKNSEIITNIKNEILSKEKQIQEIMEQNNKQKEQLESISHEIDLKLKKLSDTTKIVQIKKKNDYINFDDDIKVKEKQINNINNIIELLQIENDKLKMKLDFMSFNNGNNGEKFKIIELDKKILALNQDIKQKKLIIQEHNKCLSIKNQILKKISSIQKEISGEKEKNNKLKKKLGSTESKYILIKQDYENKFKNQWSSTNKNYKNYFQNDNVNNTQNIFTQNELNAILSAVGGNKNIFSNIMKKLNINENKNEANNNLKVLENQIEIFQKKQKMNLIKNNQLIDEIKDIEKKNTLKNKEINKLKMELDSLKNENSEDFNKDNIDDLSSKRIKSNFSRIKIDANKNKEDINII
jgi:hypothetical protein